MSARRPLLLPLVPLYAAGLLLKLLLGADKPRHRLAYPVVSVGSLSAGGAGKTPVVQALAALLLEHGFAVNILTRGYGRTSQAVERVDPQGTAERFGDEPLLLAQHTGAGVYVGASRYAAGLLAEADRSESAAPHVHLLDDGFQHRSLARVLDAVLFTQQDAEDYLLPAGNLREPLSRLREADVVILREEEETGLRPLLSRWTSADPIIWTIRRRLEVPPDAPKQPFAFCGIARPESFFTMLGDAGVTPAVTRAFPDHHRYLATDLRSLLEEARRSGADGFLTTEKDAVKMTEAMRQMLAEIGPLAVVRLTVTFADPDSVWERIFEAAQGSDGMRR